MLGWKEHFKKQDMYGGDIRTAEIFERWMKKKNEKFLAAIFLMKLYSDCLVTDIKKKKKNSLENFSS